MSALVRETCVCGAVFEDAGKYEPYVNRRLGEWRDCHEVCREAWAEATKTPARTGPPKPKGEGRGAGTGGR